MFMAKKQDHPELMELFWVFLAQKVANGPFTIVEMEDKKEILPTFQI